MCARVSGSLNCFDKIDNVDQVHILVDTHDDVAQLKIMVNEVVRVDILQATELDTEVNQV